MGATKDDVTLKITEARRRAGKINVEVTIKVATKEAANTMAAAITADKLNEKLKAAGLEDATMVSKPTVAEAGAALSNARPAASPIVAPCGCSGGADCLRGIHADDLERLERFEYSQQHWVCVQLHCVRACVWVETAQMERAFRNVMIEDSSSSGHTWGALRVDDLADDSVRHFALVTRIVVCCR